MPCTLRVQYPGAIYHVMDRGDRQEDVFINDLDRHDLVKTLAEACFKTGWQVHAYCLMRNHFHLVVEPPKANLMAGMRWHGPPQDTAASRQEFERRMETPRWEEISEEELKPFERGWCLGSESFMQTMIELMDGNLGEHHSGQLHRETDEQKANRRVAEELVRLGWAENDLRSRMKRDPGKLAMAARLRRETILPLKWIAARVQIGTMKGAKAFLHLWIHSQAKPVPKAPPCEHLRFQSTV